MSDDFHREARVMLGGASLLVASATFAVCWMLHLDPRYILVIAGYDFARLLYRAARLTRKQAERVEREYDEDDSS